MSIKILFSPFSGWTHLMSCAEHNQMKEARWLLERGASPSDQMPDTNWTAMHAAAKRGHHEMLKMLLDFGGDKNIEAV